MRGGREKVCRVWVLSCCCVVGVGFHKGGIDLDEGGVKGFGVAEGAGRMGK